MRSVSSSTKEKAPVFAPQLFGLWSMDQFLPIGTRELRAENLSNKFFSFWISPREEGNLASKTLKDLGRELLSLDLFNL